MTKRDWEQLTKTREVLQEPANATQTFSSAKYPTVSHTIPILEFMQQSWENMAQHPQFHEMSTAIEAELKNLSKWYHKVDDTDVYFICLGKVPILISIHGHAQSTI
jgi:hypothetical protein